MKPNSSINTRDYIGRKLGSVTVLKAVGEGATGAVFSGFQRTLRRQVAVKVLPKKEDPTGEKWNGFQKEAELVAALDHPGIIPIFEMGETDDYYFQIVQLARGDDLEDIVEKLHRHPLPQRRILPVPRTLGIMLEVLDALGYAHEEGVLHHDIKPANILIEQKSKRVLLTDFGIAKTIEEGTSPEHAIVGSPLYMAPERVKQERIDQRSDIYSVGTTLFKLLTIQLPLVAKDTMTLLQLKMRSDTPIFSLSPTETSPVIDDDLQKIILRAIANSPNDRFSSCAEFAGSIDSYCSTHSIEPVHKGDV